MSIRYKLDLGNYTWSCDLYITEFKICQGEEYIITAYIGSTSVIFSTRPLKTSFDKILHSNDNSLSFAIPEFDYMLLGLSKVFIHPPKVGEKGLGIYYLTRILCSTSFEIRFSFCKWLDRVQQVLV